MRVYITLSDSEILTVTSLYETVYNHKANIQINIQYNYYVFKKN